MALAGGTRLRAQHARAGSELDGGGEDKQQHAKHVSPTHDRRHVVHLLRPAQEDAQAVLDKSNYEEEGAELGEEVFLCPLRQQPVERVLEPLDQFGSRLLRRHRGAALCAASGAPRR